MKIKDSKMEWKRAYIRKTTEEEEEFYNSDEIWGGQVPDIDQDVLIYHNGDYSIDYMTDFEDGINLYENSYTEFYWCQLVSPKNQDDLENAKLDWKRVYLKENADGEEKWTGSIPKDDGEILICHGRNFSIDSWIDDLDEASLYFNADYTDFYWCELVAPNVNREELEQTAQKLVDKLF